MRVGRFRVNVNGLADGLSIGRGWASGLERDRGLWRPKKKWLARFFAVYRFWVGLAVGRVFFVSSSRLLGFRCDPENRRPFQPLDSSLLWLGCPCVGQSLTGRVVDGATGDGVASRVYLQSLDDGEYFHVAALQGGKAIPYDVRRGAILKCIQPFQRTLLEQRYLRRESIESLSKGKAWIPHKREFSEAR